MSSIAKARAEYALKLAREKHTRAEKSSLGVAAAKKARLELPIGDPSHETTVEAPAAAALDARVVFLVV
jgi:hypothetical protein